MVEFFINYPKIVFEQGEFVFDSSLPLWLLATLILVAAIIISGMLLARRKALEFWQITVLWILQLSMTILVLCIIWQPALKTEHLRPYENVIAILLDTSESMNYVEGEVPRMQQALSVLKGDTLKQLENEYTLQRYVFSGEAVTANTFDNLPAPASQTHIGESIIQVLRQARVSPLAAVIMLSDGADNNGALTQDKLSEISSYGVPVHTIGIGRDKIDEDLELQEITVPDQAMPGTLLSARVVIRHDNAALARVKVYDGEKLLTTAEVILPEDTPVTTVWVDFEISDTGNRLLTFSLDRLANEQIIQNNSRSKIVEIKEQKYTVLYIEGEPRWEYKFLRRALTEDPSVTLVSLLRVSQNKFYRQGIDASDELEQGFPTERSELFKYDALIIGSIEAVSFTLDQQAMIRDFVSDRGGSLIMLAGLSGLGNGGWGQSSIEEVLPARLSETESSFVRERAKVVLTTTGRNTAMMKFSETPDENIRLWRELPEIADYQNIGSLRPAAVSLLNIIVGDKQQPLLVTQPYGKGRSYILATGGTWRWQMSLPHEDQRHETFWRQLLREMVINSPGRFELSAQQFDDKVKLNSEIRNPSFEIVEDLNLTAVITRPSGETDSVVMHPSTERRGIMTAEFEPDESGTYSIEVISSRNDDPIESARLVVHHDAGQAESYSLRRNQTLLDILANVTGGQNWNLDDIDELPDAIRYSSAGITEQEIHPLWDAPLVFLLLLTLKTVEWLLRRRWRTI